MFYKVIRILFSYLLVLLTVSFIPLELQGIIYIIGLLTIGKIYYNILKTILDIL